MAADKRRTFPEGILGFPVAPFQENGEINQKALQQNIQYLVDEKLSAIFIACGSGEFQSLSDDEYRGMVETAVETTKGNVPVYTGVGGNIRHAVKQAEWSADLGADGYLILPPYLINGEQEGLYQYYETIIQSTDLNAIVYQRDNAISNLKTVKKLAEHPQVVGLKDGFGNMELNVELTQHLGERFTWMNGMPFAEITMPAYYSLGFQTYSSAISNYIPHISRQYFEALKQGDKHTLRNLYTDILLPINNIRKQKKGYAVSLIKAGMEIAGLPAGLSTRAPVVPVEKEHYKQLEEVLKKAEINYPARQPQK
ncbi:5-dehydro-4-deoxyglucarate dehydratase [Alteribacillus sp. HJP-4]|uniref:5-dehydro-4-deoxyglucarate dehydratase n=1 Tax=Alteribacillus sp. HJP-4 TaxID=2775394 RepID=UPI0035CD3A2B